MYKAENTHHPSPSYNERAESIVKITKRNTESKENETNVLSWKYHKNVTETMTTIGVSMTIFTTPIIQILFLVLSLLCSHATSASDFFISLS